jgi:hypothetical protein
MSKLSGVTGGAKEDGIVLKRAEGLVLVMDTPKGTVVLGFFFSQYILTALLGRGVFAARDIPAKTVLEVSPVLVLDPVENEEHIKKTELYNYT